MENTIYKSDMHEVASNAAKKATQALQKLISSDTRVILVDVEKLEKPKEEDAHHLVERCIKYYKEDKVIILAPVKMYYDNGDKKDSGAMLMFVEKKDMYELGELILSNMKSGEEPFSTSMHESAVTEALNIIGNAYINVISKVYNSTIMSMVPEVVDVTNFDGFISNMMTNLSNRVYIVFDTKLLITKKVVKIPFVLAVSLEIPKS